jgi:hypothetical protein
VADPPAADSQRDDTVGPWTVAWAATRDDPALDRPQRLVVVGSNDWFVDQVTGEMTVVDGRPVARNPGNAELFEASVQWLAGRDELIASSPSAVAVPLIRPLSEVQLRLIRWLVIGAMPVLVLIVGLAWRVIRG